MAEGKKSFIAYCDWLETFEALPDDKAGQLAKHLFRYVNDLNPESNDIVVNATFAGMKQALKRDLEKYNQYIDKQKSNGAKGGRPRKNPTEPKKPKPLFKNPTEPKKADSVSDNVNDSEKINNEPKGSSETIVPPNQEKINYKALVDFFNENRHSMPAVLKLTEKRKKTIRARVKEYNKQTLANVIVKASKSDFLNGKNVKDWTADFDWIMKPSNFTKILEGSYDQKELYFKDKEDLAF